MKLPILSRAKPTLPNNTENDSHTVISSGQHTPTSQIEKQTALPATSRQNSTHEEEKKVVETTPMDEAEALEKLSEEPEYPSGAKLAIIVIALSLSVFLMALVCTIQTHAMAQNTDFKLG